MKKKKVIITAKLKQAILARGYALEEEYAAILKRGKGMNKLNLVDNQGNTEGLWVFPLEDDNVAGQTFKFIFFNDPLGMVGPRPISGMVGVATSKGAYYRAVASTTACSELFKTLGGQAAIDYHKQCVAKEKARQAKKPKKAVTA